MGVAMRHMGYRGDVEVWRGNVRDGCGVLAQNGEQLIQDTLKSSTYPVYFL